MSPSIIDKIFDVPPHYDFDDDNKNFLRRPAPEESDRPSKRLKTDDLKPVTDQSLSQCLVDKTQPMAGIRITDPEVVQSSGGMTTTVEMASVEEQTNDSFSTQELSEKLIPSLEGLILKGCLENTDTKSTLIKERYRYCAHSYSSMEMLAKDLSAIDLLAEHKLMDYCRQNCTNLRCLRLSYCIVNVELMQSIKNWFRRLQCLHLEHIYGIETAEEWSAFGKIFKNSLINLSFSVGSRDIDLTPMLKKMKVFCNFAIEEYRKDMSELFATLCPNLYKLSLINYYDVDDYAIRALAMRCGQSLTEMEVIYDCYDSRRANSLEIFDSICRQLTNLREFRIKFITSADMRPVFKLTKLKDLDVQFSHSCFLYFPGMYHLESLRTLSITNARLTPRRVNSMGRAFPFLQELSINGPRNRQFLDVPVFCCDCKNKDKTIDECTLCYQNCAVGLIELSILKTIKLNYVKIKSGIAPVLPYIPSLKRLVVNPFELQCSYSLLLSAMKLAEMRPFKLIIRKCFIKEALEEETYLPPNLEIIEYADYSKK